MMSCCKEVDSADDEHFDDGNEEEQQAEDKEKQAYDQQSGDGKHREWSQEWEHLEGLQQPDGEQLKSELRFSTQGSATKTSFFNQTPASAVASHNGRVRRTDSPPVETPGRSSRTNETSFLLWLQTSWTIVKDALTCCFCVDD